MVNNMMDKIYISPRMKEIRLNCESLMVRSMTTDNVFTRKHDAMFDDVEEEE